MEKIDRLGWAAGISFTAYGARVGVRINNPQFMDRLLGYLPPGWEPAPSPVVERLYSLFIAGEGPRTNVRRFNILYSDLIRVARTTDLDQVFERFESDLRLYVAEVAHHRLFVHAGVVGWRGRAIVIPGRSFSGKTTLVAELVRAGASYYSDEYAVFDSRGRVHPYPKPLSLRENGSFQQKDYPAEAFGGRTGTKPLSVGLVVMSEYKSGAKWRPRQLSAGQGVLALLANTVAARRQPKTAFAILQQVTAKAPVLKGIRGEAKEIVGSILQRLED